MDSYVESKESLASWRVLAGLGPKLLRGQVVNADLAWEALFSGPVTFVMLQAIRERARAYVRAGEHPDNAAALALHDLVSFIGRFDSQTAQTPVPTIKTP